MPLKFLRLSLKAGNFVIERGLFDEFLVKSM